MMNPVGRQVKHIGRSWGRRLGTDRGGAAAQEVLSVVCNPSTSQLSPTFAIVTVAWFL
jgi:hypothetical protein